MPRKIRSTASIYIGIGRNKFYHPTTASSTTPLEYFPNGIFLRFEENEENIYATITNFFANYQQECLPAAEREILLKCEQFGEDCYVECYFKNPSIIVAFLEKFEGKYTFIEKNSNRTIAVNQLIEMVESL